MKYILIITAVFICSCGSSNEQQAQTEQIVKDNREASKALVPLIKERDAKITRLMSEGKNEEAAAVTKEFKRKRDSIMRINY